VLDIGFDENGNLTRKGHSAASYTVIRHTDLNPIKTEKTTKVGIKIKGLKAGWDNECLSCGDKFSYVTPFMVCEYPSLRLGKSLQLKS